MAQISVDVPMLWDNYVYSLSPTNTYSGTTYLNSGISGTSNNAITYLIPDLSSIPQFAKVVSATLYMYSTVVPATAVGLLVDVTTTAPNQETCNFSTRPTYNNPTKDMVTWARPLTTNVWHSVSITNLLRYLVGINDRNNLALILTQTVSNSLYASNSTEAADNHPYITIVYDDTVKETQIPIIYDTYVDSYAPSTDYHTAISFYAGYYSTGPHNYQSYIIPDLSSIPNGAIVSAASIYLYLTNYNGIGSAGMYVDLTATSPNRTTCTWNAKPTYNITGNRKTWTCPTSTGVFQTTSILDQIKWLVDNNDRNNLALILTQVSTGSAGYIFTSSNNSVVALRPSIIVSYTIPVFTGNDERLNCTETIKAADVSATIPNSTERIVASDLKDLNITERIIDSGFKELDFFETIKLSGLFDLDSNETIKAADFKEIDSTETIMDLSASFKSINTTESIREAASISINSTETIQSSGSSIITTTETIKAAVSSDLVTHESVKISGYKTINCTETIKPMTYSSNKTTLENVNVLTFKTDTKTLLTGSQVSVVKIYGYDYARSSPYKWLGDVWYDNSTNTVKLTSNATSDVCYASLQVTQSGVMPAKPTSVSSAVMRIFYTATSYSLTDIYSGIDFDIYVNGVKTENNSPIANFGVSGPYNYIELPLTISTISKINAGSVILIQEGYSGSVESPYHRGKGIQVNASYSVQVIYTGTITKTPGVKWLSSKETIKDATIGGTSGYKVINSTENVLTPANIHNRTININFNNLRQQIQSNSGELMFPERGITTNTFSEYHLGDFFIHDYLNPWDPLRFPDKWASWVANPTFISGVGTVFYVADPQCKAYIYADATNVLPMTTGTVSNPVLNVFIDQSTFDSTDINSISHRFNITLKTVTHVSPGVDVTQNAEALRVSISAITTLYGLPVLQFNLPNTFLSVIAQGSTLVISDYDNDFQGKDALIKTSYPFELSYTLTTTDSVGSDDINATEFIKPSKSINCTETIIKPFQLLDSTETVKTSQSINTTETVTIHGYDTGWYNINSFETVTAPPPIKYSGVSNINMTEKITGLAGQSDKNATETVIINSGAYDHAWMVVDVLFDSSIGYVRPLKESTAQPYQIAYDPNAEFIYSGYGALTHTYTYEYMSGGILTHPELVSDEQTEEDWMYLVPKQFSLPAGAVLEEVTLHIFKQYYSQVPLKMSWGVANKTPIGLSMTWANKPVRDSGSPEHTNNNILTPNGLHGNPMWYFLGVTDQFQYMMDHNLVDRGIVFYPPTGSYPSPMNTTDNSCGAWDWEATETLDHLIDPSHTLDDPYRPTTDVSGMILPITPYFLVKYMIPKPAQTVYNKELNSTEKVKSSSSASVNSTERVVSSGYRTLNATEKIYSTQASSDIDTTEYVLDPQRSNIDASETIIGKIVANISVTEKIIFGPPIYKDLASIETVLLVPLLNYKDLRTIESIIQKSIGVSDINVSENVKPFIKETPNEDYTTRAAYMAQKATNAIAKLSRPVDFAYSRPDLSNGSKATVFDYVHGVSVLISDTASNQSSYNTITAAKEYYEEYEVYINADSVSLIDINDWRTSNCTLHVAYGGRWMRVKNLTIQTIGETVIYAKLVFWADELTRNPLFTQISLPWLIPYT